MNTAAPTAADLSVSVGLLRLRNPIIAASGTFGYGIEFAHLLNLNSLGAFVVKGLSREPIEGAPAPRVVETASGMLNAIGLQNVGVRAFVAEKLPVLRNYDTPVIANVFGYALEDYVEVIRVLEDADGLAGYELNISCPNVKKGGMQFGCDPSQISDVVAAARRAAAKRPLWVKLSPLVTDIGLIARSAAEAGADALVRRREGVAAVALPVPAPLARIGPTEAADAAKKAFLTNRIGDFGFLCGIILLWSIAGTINFEILRSHVSTSTLDLGDAAIAVGLLIFCGAVGNTSTPRAFSAAATVWAVPTSRSTRKKIRFVSISGGSRHSPGVSATAWAITWALRWSSARRSPTPPQSR